jgi:Ca2+-binding EF-hand superfamily protein
MTRFAILGAFAFCAFSAFAGEDVTFSTVDKNADGFISESEFVGWKTADGEMSPAEALVKFIEIDADASGMISEAEMQAATDAKEAESDTQMK